MQRDIEFDQEAAIAGEETPAGDAVRVSLPSPEPISVIIPALDEAENIARFLFRLDRAMTRATISYEAIVVVDDRSTDATDAIAGAIARDHYLPVRVLTRRGQPDRPLGLMEGFAVARFDVLALIEPDRLSSPESLLGMLDRLKDADVVLADRGNEKYQSTNILRDEMSHTFGLYTRMLFGIDSDIQSGLMVFRRKVYEGVTTKPGRWGFALHLVTWAVSGGYVVVTAPVSHDQAHAGKSKATRLAVGTRLTMEACRLNMSATKRRLVNGFRNRGSEISKRTHQDARVPEANDTDADIAEEVNRYAVRLAADARSRRNSTAADREKVREYNEDSLRRIRVGGQEVSLFAPFRREFSAMQTFTFGQALAIGTLGLACLIGLLFSRTGMIVAAIAVVTVLYLTDLLTNAWLSVWTLKRSAEEHIDEAIVHALADADWPRYTILCPLYRETEVIPQFVEAMLALDYPTDKLEILLLTEEDDASTLQAIRSQRLPSHFTLVTVPAGKPRTKPRACNYGLLKSTGDYVVIYDAEDIPDPLQLKKAVLTFANQGPDTACVQAKLNFYNPGQNMLTRWFTAEYSLWFDLTLPGLQRLGVPLPLGGTSNHFRTSSLRLMGGWDAYNVTEDCDLGLRIANYGFKTTMLNSTTYEEANSQLKNWIRQRSRWIKGYMQTYLVYMRRPQDYLRQGRFKEFLSLQLFIGGKTLVLLVNPFMWLLLVTYILFRPVDLYHTLFPAPVLYMSAVCLIFGNFFYTYTHLIGCMQRNHSHLVKWTLFIPIYWAMASAAAFMALQQLILKPHYWEKTQHGLHLHLSGSSLMGTTVTEESLSMEDTLRLPVAVLKTLHRLPDTPRPEEDALVAVSLPSNTSLEPQEFDFEVREKALQALAGDPDIGSFLEEFKLEVVEKTVRETTVVLRMRSHAKRSQDPLQTGGFDLEKWKTIEATASTSLKRLASALPSEGGAPGASVPSSETMEPLQARSAAAAGVEVIEENLL